MIRQTKNRLVFTELKFFPKKFVAAVASLVAPVPMIMHSMRIIGCKFDILHAIYMADSNYA